MPSPVARCFILAACTALCAQAGAQATNARAIYRCESEGVLTFSDRPCGASAQAHELDSKALNTFEAPPSAPVSRRTPTQPKTTKNSSARAIDADKHEQKCERLAQGLEEIRARQRSGYKAKEGERLREREAKLKARLRDARCR